MDEWHKLAGAPTIITHDLLRLLPDAFLRTIYTDMHLCSICFSHPDGAFVRSVDGFPYELEWRAALVAMNRMAATQPWRPVLINEVRRFLTRDYVFWPFRCYDFFMRLIVLEAMRKTFSTHVMPSFVYEDVNTKYILTVAKEHLYNSNLGQGIIEWGLSRDDYDYMIKQLFSPRYYKDFFGCAMCQKRKTNNCPKHYRKMRLFSSIELDVKMIILKKLSVSDLVRLRSCSRSACGMAEFALVKHKDLPQKLHEFERSWEWEIDGSVSITFYAPFVKWIGHLQSAETPESVSINYNGEPLKKLLDMSVQSGRNYFVS